MAREPQPSVMVPNINVRIASLERLGAKGSGELAASRGCEDFVSHDNCGSTAHPDILGCPLETLGGNLTVSHVRQELITREDPGRRVR
jgi:hypothetical protein